MTRRRFFSRPDDVDLQQRVVQLNPDETRHLRDVLRLKVDDIVYVFDGTGNEYRCRIIEVKRDSTRLEIETEVEAASPESGLVLTLALSLLKGEKFDLVVQKATELGVSAVVPVLTRYSDIQLRDRSDGLKRVARWQRIALEAVKQCGRAVVPTVAEPISIERFFTENRDEPRVMFAERSGASFEELRTEMHGCRKITALVGSEGGWSDSELEQALHSGWRVVTLGGRIMRAETAAIVITALLQHTFGDLK